MGGLLIGGAITLARARGQDDSLNIPAAGALTGAILGLRSEFLCIHSSIRLSIRVFTGE
jgi:hypothetical protein